VPRVCVVGSANLDFTVALPRLPRVGETVSAGALLVPSSCAPKLGLAAVSARARVTCVAASAVAGSGSSLPSASRNTCTGLRGTSGMP